MDAVKYLKERKRMFGILGTGDSCLGLSCSKCPFNAKKGCVINEIESVAIVEKWSAENPQKTMLQDFLEKYPNARVDSKGRPVSCPVNLGYPTDCKSVKCSDCWNRPLEG